MDNVLETVTETKYTQITELKAIMKEHGAMRAMMSGSGPTVFAAFADEAQAQAYYQNIKNKYPGAIFARTVNQNMLEERVALL
jgi:4-diphosphocytidyl-2-C-methyl-D-erythritol kinase